METPEALPAPISRRLPADPDDRVGKVSSDRLLESPRASSSLGPDATSEEKASVPGMGLALLLPGDGVRVPRMREPAVPSGGGASWPS
jgi:hypothetical protein